VEKEQVRTTTADNIVMHVSTKQYAKQKNFSRECATSFDGARLRARNGQPVERLLPIGLHVN